MTAEHPVKPFVRTKLHRWDIPQVVTAKWCDALLDEGFVPMPKRLVRTLSKVFTGEHALSDLSFVLAVADYARPNLSRPPSIEFLAFLAGMTVEEAKIRLESLVDRGLAQYRVIDGSTEVSLDGLHRKILEMSKE